jgi:hypothetical protein
VATVRTLLSIGLLSVALLCAGGATGSSSVGPLRGIPLAKHSNLHLLVADRPPFLLDVDSGHVTPLPGAATPSAPVVWVTPVAGRGAVVAAESYPRARLTAVRGTKRRLSALGTGETVWPAAGGAKADSVWIESRDGRSRCTLRRVALVGRTLRARRSVPCSTRTSVPVAASPNLVWSPTRVLDPRTGATAMETSLPIVAVAADELLLDGPGGGLTLLNARTGAERPLPWPSPHGALDTPAVDLTGRYVALAFANPSRTSPAGQWSDIWLLDTATAELTQLPGMPAFVALKATSMVWTRNGGLVLLAESAERDLVAFWKPGQPRLAVKTVRLPERDGGSDTFAILP